MIDVTLDYDIIYLAHQVRMNLIITYLKRI